MSATTIKTNMKNGLMKMKMQENELSVNRRENLTI